MNVKKLAIAASLLLAASPMLAMAQEAGSNELPAAAEAPASNWSWSLAVTSDYVYRGITQSNYQPAVQGGVNYAFNDSGFYAGLWASNVDFADADGPEIELDTYVGWSRDLSDDWNLDLMLTHYTYLGSRDIYGDIDFNQLDSKLTYKGMLTLTGSYSDDYVNGGYSYLYYSLSGAWDIGAGVNLNAGVGVTDFSDGIDGYTDYSLGVSRQFGPVNAALNYYDTDINDFRASDRVVLSFTFEG